ncbi:hypothetical protein LTR66_007229 [Elasticomyces elasticus]|nr:hypothetical protein LTR66_007229 [Elasticomyces elasticus]
MSSFGGKFAADVQASAESDSFGYHRSAVCLTRNGRLIALDAGSSGRIVWNVPVWDHARDISSSPVLKPLPDGTVEISGLEIDNSGTPPLVVDAATGEILTRDAIRDRRTMVEDATAAPVGKPTSVYYTLETGELCGKLDQKDAPLQELWRFSPSKGETIVNVTSRPPTDPVASIGKVLGDRRVLYKYLNPNIVLVTTISTAAHTATVYLLDGISGTILFSNSHAGIDTSHPIPSTLSENWFAYSYAIDSATSSASKGHQLVVGELYESPFPNERGKPLAPRANHSTLHSTPSPHPISQTYNIPEAISHLAVTQTRQGITSRHLLAVLPASNSLVEIPRSAIDPRRPVARDPTSAELAEGLERYTPVLDFDPKWTLNHRREAVGIRAVRTTAATLESACLVFAYGVDVFGTRVAPSAGFDVLGSDFNKVQMLGTVLALAVGTVVVAPLVARKQINALWQFS